MKKFLFFFFFTLYSIPLYGKDISIVTWNVGDSDHKVPCAQELITTLSKDNLKVDILILQEIFLKRFLKLKELYGYKFHIHSSEISKDLKNIGMLSNYNFNESDILVFKKNVSGALISKLKINNSELTIASVHLDYIKAKKRTKNGYVKFDIKSLSKTLYKEIFKKNQRLTEVEKLLLEVGMPGKRTILAGDFNTVSYSSSVRKIKKYYKDSFSGIKNLFSSKSTYKKVKSPIRPRIDFIFHSEDIKLKSSKVIKMTPGDHFPVKADFTL